MSYLNLKLNDKFLAELNSGHYRLAEVKPRIVNVLGTVPKKDSPEFRIIHDCSQPQGFAVNAHAGPHTVKQKYQSVDDALRLIKPGYYMAKIDLKHAYRSVRLHESEFNALGLKWPSLTLSQTPLFTCTTRDSPLALSLPRPFFTN